MEEKVRERQAQFELREWTLGQVLDHTVERFPDNEALVYPDRNYRQTLSEFGALVDDFAKGLMALGVQKGEKVAVWATNVPYWVALQFATAKIDLVVTGLNSHRQSKHQATENEHIFHEYSLEESVVLP